MQNLAPTDDPDDVPVNDHGALTGLGDDDHPQYVKDTGDTMTGELTIDRTGQAVDSKIYLKADAGKYSLMEVYAGGGAGVAGKRWAFGRTSAVEPGSNSGSDFAIWRYKDDGSYLGRPMIIDRATGEVRMDAGPITDLGVATKEYVDARDAAGTYGWAGANGFTSLGGGWTDLRCVRYGTLVTIQGMLERNSSLALTASAGVQIGTIGSTNWRPVQRTWLTGTLQLDTGATSKSACGIDLRPEGTIFMYPFVSGTLAANGSGWVSVNGTYMGT